MSPLLYQILIMASVVAMTMDDLLTFCFSRVTRKRLGMVCNLWRNPFPGRTLHLSELLSHHHPIRSG